VHGDTELLFDRLDAFADSETRGGELQVPDMLDDLPGKLVTFSGASLSGHQTGETGTFESRLDLIEGWARDGERGGHLDDGQALDAMASQHLVAYLEQISGVEERVLAKQGVGDGRGGGVESAGALEFQ